MTADLALFGTLALLTGLLFTSHVLIVAGLRRRRPRWPTFVALLVPPFAPLLAYRAGLHARALLWMIAAVAYTAVRLSFHA